MISKHLSSALHQIPAHPLAYGDAKALMANLAGPRGDGFAGSMNISYNVGPGPAVVNMGMYLYAFLVCVCFSGMCVFWEHSLVFYGNIRGGPLSPRHPRDFEAEGLDSSAE